MHSSQTSQVTPTMSSLEIAHLTNKQHRHVLRDIRETLEEVNIDSAQFWTEYKDLSGKSNTCFNLPRRECDLVITGYSAKYRLAVIDRWHELEGKQNKQLTKLELYEKMVADEKERLALLQITRQQSNDIRERQVTTDDSSMYASVKRMKTMNPNSRPSGKLLSRISEVMEYPVLELYSHWDGAACQTYHKDVWEKVYPDMDFPD